MTPSCQSDLRTLSNADWLAASDSFTRDTVSLLNNDTGATKLVTWMIPNVTKDHGGSTGSKPWDAQAIGEQRRDRWDVATGTTKYWN
jgi:hypothetical protein